MPSGRAHDAITFLSAPAAAAAAYAATRDIGITAAFTCAFLFGGLLFGPDLDCKSKQYSRWSILRPLWYPYRIAFKHRSRWSHGLVFGTLIRVVYFMGAASLAAYLVFLLNASIAGGDVPKLSVFANAWQQFGGHIRGGLGEYFLPSVFAGMWAGAASHTFTDMAGTYIKTGRVSEFL